MIIKHHVVLRASGIESSNELTYPNRITGIFNRFQTTITKNELNVHVGKELIQRQLIADGLISRSVFLGSWQIILWPLKYFIKKGSWPVSFRDKIFNLWIIGPFEIRHYL